MQNLFLSSLDGQRFNVNFWFLFSIYCPITLHKTNY